MPNEKMENILNLALDATAEERGKSVELDVGYSLAGRTWEVIVKYGGTAEALTNRFRELFPSEYGNIRFTNLRNEYAILVLPESVIQAVAALPEIEYMEKPKRLFFAVNNAKRASCISALQAGNGIAAIGEMPEFLDGKDVIVACIDSGERVIIMSS